MLGLNSRENWHKIFQRGEYDNCDHLLNFWLYKDYSKTYYISQFSLLWCHPRLSWTCIQFWTKCHRNNNSNDQSIFNQGNEILMFATFSNNDYFSCLRSPKSHVHLSWELQLDVLNGTMVQLREHFQLSTLIKVYTWQISSKSSALGIKFTQTSWILQPRAAAGQPADPWPVLKKEFWPDLAPGFLSAHGEARALLHLTFSSSETVWILKVLSSKFEAFLTQPNLAHDLPRTTHIFQSKIKSIILGFLAWKMDYFEFYIFCKIPVCRVDLQTSHNPHYRGNFDLTLGNF